MRHFLQVLSERKISLQKKHLVLLLDFDGTLAPIAATPEEATLPPETRRQLRHLSKNKNVTLAIVSGRALRDIQKKVGLPGLIYVGNHGLEMTGDGCRLVPARRDWTLLRQNLAPLFKKYPGSLLEEKGAVVAVHYRTVPATTEKAFRNEAKAILTAMLPWTGMILQQGKKVLELRPRQGENKGTIVLKILERLQKKKPSSSLLPIYLGDDRTDEYAIRALKGVGIGVRVGASKKIRTTPYFVRNYKDVQDFLGWCLKELRALSIH